MDRLKIFFGDFGEIFDSAAPESNLYLDNEPLNMDAEVEPWIGPSFCLPGMIETRPDRG